MIGMMKLNTLIPLEAMLLSLERKVSPLLLMLLTSHLSMGDRLALLQGEFSPSVVGGVATSIGEAMPPLEGPLLPWRGAVYC